MHCVSVEFDIGTGHEEAFLARVLRQARESLEHEPGCHVFDVWQDAGRPLSVFLYEVYSDAAAFEAHLATPHFLAFDAEVAGMVIDKRVRRWEAAGTGSVQEARHGA